MDWLGLAPIVGALAPWGLLVLALLWAVHQVRRRKDLEIVVRSLQARVASLMLTISYETESRTRLLEDMRKIESDRQAWESEHAKSSPHPGETRDFGGPAPGGV